MATVYSQTRFSSSAYVQWQRLVNSYKLFAEAMTQASTAMGNELDPLQYQVRGQVSTVYAYTNYLFIVYSILHVQHVCTVSKLNRNPWILFIGFCCRSPVDA